MNLSKAYKGVQIYKLLISIVICQAAGLLGSIFTITGTGSWYASLARPSFAPPNWVFGPVWTTLYLLMGISLYLVWSYGLKSKEAKVGVVFFGVQLVLNSLWSILFFGMQNPLAAFVELIVLWLMILGTMIAFYKVRKASMYLLVPYLLWVGFAGLLNYYIYLLN